MAQKLPRGITHIGPKQYRARMFHNGRQHSIGVFQTIGDARAALDIARSERARGIFIPPAERRRERRDEEAMQRLHSVTVSEWCKDWLERLRGAGRSIGTTRSYSSTMNVHVLPSIGDQRLIDVTRQDIDDLLEQVRAKGGPWENVARTLRAFYRAAIAAEVGGVTESPVRASIPKGDPHSIDPEQVATPEQVVQLAEAMPERLRIAVPLAAWCALRQGELLGLQRRDLDLKAALLHVRRQWHSKSQPPAYAPPKTGSARSVSVPGALIEPLRQHLDGHVLTGAESPLFPSSRDRKRPMGQTGLDKAWRQARADVGVPNLRFHDLRATGLTEYARAGATLDELMRRGGHRDVNVALRYQRATAERDKALTEKLNAAIGGK